MPRSSISSQHTKRVAVQLVASETVRTLYATSDHLICLVRGVAVAMGIIFWLHSLSASRFVAVAYGVCGDTLNPSFVLYSPAAPAAFPPKI